MTLKSRKMNFPRSEDMVNNIKLKASIFQYWYLSAEDTSRLETLALPC